MDLYTRVAYENSRHLTLRYSTSFGISSRFFGEDIRSDIYAIYGLVRIADEIVDTYKGTDARAQLDDFERQTYASLASGYSTNLIIHAFAQSARKYDITKTLIAPFFESMRMDLSPQTYRTKDYERYIHGSAEVVGLMCLKVFVAGDKKAYDELSPGASSLGAAYQKVNFLRDMAADYKELGRLYFPGVSFETFDEAAKNAIILDIRNDFKHALASLRKLPVSSRKATMMSYTYYTELLNRLERTPAETIKQRRIRVPSRRKFTLMIRTAVLKGQQS